MGEPQKYVAAIAELTPEGVIVVKAISGELIRIDLGPAQAINVKIGLDRYVALNDLRSVLR